MSGRAYVLLKMPSGWRIIQKAFPLVARERAWRRRLCYSFPRGLQDVLDREQLPRRRLNRGSR